MKRKFKFRRQQDENKKIAKIHIKELFQQARIMFKTDPKLSDRYMKLAWKLKTKFKVEFTPAQKKRMCKKCLSYLVPSVNCTVRVNKGNVVYTCKNCKAIIKHGYRKEQKRRNQNGKDNYCI